MFLRNALKTASAILRLRLLGTRTPLSVILSVTNRCNFDCAYCPVRSHTMPEMSTGELLGLIDEMADAGTQRVGLMGGEPMMRDDIGEVIARCKRRGMFVTMGTNGSLLPADDNLDPVRGVDALVFSIDGPSAHDRYRHEGSYQLVLDAMKLARRNGIEVWNTAVLTDLSVGDIDILLDLSEEHGFATNFSPLMHSEVCADDRRHPSLDREGYIRAVDRLIEEKRRGRPIINSLSYLRYIREWPDLSETLHLGDTPKGAPRLPCYASRLFCYVECNGDVYPCNTLIGRYQPPNALATGFRTAFESLGERPCTACYSFGYTELNLVFGLRYDAVLNALSLARKR